MKQIDLMKQTERKKKVLAALCAVLCTGLLSGCSSGGVLDSKEKNEQLKDTILETYDALIGGAGTADLMTRRSFYPGAGSIPTPGRQTEKVPISACGVKTRWENYSLELNR